MPDPFEDAFAGIGEDFESYFPTAPVTVERIDPDTGAALDTSADVPALKRSRRRQPMALGGGGELAADTCRFVLRVTRLDWVVKARDRVTEADGATTWVVESVELLAFNQLAALNVTLKRD